MQSTKFNFIVSDYSSQLILPFTRCYLIQKCSHSSNLDFDTLRLYSDGFQLRKKNYQYRSNSYNHQNLPYTIANVVNLVVIEHYIEYQM